MGRIIDKMKQAVRSWLNVREADPLNIDIIEAFDFRGNAIKNKIWYRGSSYELQQLYEQIDKGIDRYKFWACKSSPGMEMRKIHTGIPGNTVDMLATVTLADMGTIEIKDGDQRGIWEHIEEENGFIKGLESTVKQVLVIGDGAYKLTYDTDISEYPIPEFFAGDMIEFVNKRGRLQEIVFKTVYEHDYRKYILSEHYGYGYIKNHLFKDGEEVPLDAIPQTKGLKDVMFSTYKENEAGEVTEKGKYMLAVPVRIFESSNFKGRGQSIFDKKVDAYDSLDEAWSQWMDALRAGRTKEYIPENLIPRNSKTGELMRPNAFDHRFIKKENDMREGGKNQIDVVQPTIPHESYAATYITALDQCLQGIISPSTLGIDVKKLDNAEAQREKEKATLYTRNAIVAALEHDIPKVVEIAIRAYKELTTKTIYTEEIKVSLEFGEYANPSFESQVETVAKARNAKIMSTEASVEELYGDSKSDDWKKKEVARLKEEQGIAVIEEPVANKVAGNFEVNME